MLPELSGERVLKKLCQQNVAIPILILTAKDGLKDKVLGFENGCDNYLTKLFHRKELIMRS